jgi:hypothetical protein
MITWKNNGTLGGTFYDANWADPCNRPKLETIELKSAITFDVNDLMVLKNDAGSAVIHTPDSLTRNATGPNDFTVIYEVYNPVIDSQEWLLTWARRYPGADANTNTMAAFGYGYNGAYGALAHWNDDMGFNRWVPSANNWHTIGATYDGSTETVAVDGIVQTVVTNRDRLIRPNEIITIGAPYIVDANSARNWLGGTPGTGFGRPEYMVGTDNLRYNGSVASIKVYDASVPSESLAFLTRSNGSRVDLDKDSNIDFKDYAIFANKWLTGPTLWP